MLLPALARLRSRLLACVQVFILVGCAKARSGENLNGIHAAACDGSAACDAKRATPKTRSSDAAAPWPAKGGGTDASPRLDAGRHNGRDAQSGDASVSSDSDAAGMGPDGGVSVERDGSTPDASEDGGRVHHDGSMPDRPDDNVSSPLVHDRCDCVQADETRCGTFERAGCPRVDCGACSAPASCVAFPDRSLCIACRDGSDGVLTGDYSTTSDAHELRGVTEVTGNLIVYAQPAVLPSLTCLRRVDGSLTVMPVDSAGTTALSGLDALSQLESVGGSVEITELSSPGGVSLTTLHGLEQLRTIGGDLDINVGGLQDIAGLSGLTSIGGQLYIDGRAQATPEITDLHGLEQLTSLGSLSLQSLPLLSSLHGLGAVEMLSTVSINDAPVLTSIDALHGLRSADYIGLVRVPELADLNGLGNLTTLNRLDLKNSAVMTLAPLAGISALMILQLTDNPSLVSLDGLQQVSSLQLQIQRCGVTSLDGLGGLTAAGSLFLQSNPALERIDALAQLAHVDSMLMLDDNPALSSLHGLEALHDVTGELALANLAGIQNLQPLSGLHTTGELFVVGLPQLHDLQGLENLTQVSTRLGIANDAQLSSLGALSMLAGSVMNLYVFDNPKLSRCEPAALAAKLATTCGCPYTSATGCFCHIQAIQNHLEPFECLSCGAITACGCDDSCDCTSNDNTPDCSTSH